MEIYFVATENQENGSINSLARSTSFIQPGENVEYADTGAMLNTSLLARAEVEKVHSDHVEWKYSVIVKIVREHETLGDHRLELGVHALLQVEIHEQRTGCALRSEPFEGMK